MIGCSDIMESFNNCEKTFYETSTVVTNNGGELFGNDARGCVSTILEDSLLFIY